MKYMYLQLPGFSAHWYSTIKRSLYHRNSIPKRSAVDNSFDSSLSKIYHPYLIEPKVFVDLVRNS